MVAKGLTAAFCHGTWMSFFTKHSPNSKTTDCIKISRKQNLTIQGSVAPYADSNLCTVYCNRCRLQKKECCKAINETTQWNATAKNASKPIYSLWREKKFSLHHVIADNFLDGLPADWTRFARLFQLTRTLVATSLMSAPAMYEAGNLWLRQANYAHVARNRKLIRRNVSATIALSRVRNGFGFGIFSFFHVKGIARAEARLLAWKTSNQTIFVPVRSTGDGTTLL